MVGRALMRVEDQGDNIHIPQSTLPQHCPILSVAARQRIYSEEATGTLLFSC